MKIKVDKMPEIPKKCFFIGTCVNKNGTYMGCKLNKNRKCEFTANCGFLVAENETTAKNDFQHCTDTKECKYLKIQKHYTPNKYQVMAMRTADPKLNTEERLLEGLIGLNSEAGEALDIYKKHVFQKHNLDKEKTALELGDALWYLTEAAVALGYSLDDIMEMNIEKLIKRYPYGFDPERSKNRED